MATGKTKAIIALVVFIIVVGVVLGVGLGVALKQVGTLQYYSDTLPNQCSKTFTQQTVQFKDVRSCSVGMTANSVQFYYWVDKCPPPSTAYYCAWIYHNSDCSDDFTYLGPSDCKTSAKGLSYGNVQWVAN